MAVALGPPSAELSAVETASSPSLGRMMDLYTVLRLLRQHAEELRGMGVLSMSVFGSVARGEARPDSDVDVLVDLERGVTLFDFVGIKDRLEEILACPVDLATRRALRKEFRDEVLACAVQA